MSWYYVLNGERQGPTELKKVQELYSESTLKSEDYVWTKGFDNWKKISDVEDIVSVSSTPEVSEIPMEIPRPIPQEKEKVSILEKSNDQQNIFIRIGEDRGTQVTEYGPFNLEMLVKLYNENRINGKTNCFINGMNDWYLLAEYEDFEQVFNEAPPEIKDTEKRNDPRKPFIARLFIESKKKIYEGICRDVSIGGMQVLVEKYPGNAGDKISINVHPENSDYHFVADGEVVRVLDGGHGFSFRFINLNTEATSSIQKYLNT